MNSEGKDPPHKQSVLHTNLSVVSSLVDLIGSSFGPKGNFKFVLKDISSENSENIKGIITTKSGNDIIKNIQIQHPVGHLIARVCGAQNDISSDGTCYVVLIIGTLLHEAAKLVRQGLHPNYICSNFTEALEIASEKLETLKIPLLNDSLPLEKDNLLSFRIHPNRKYLHALCFSALSTKILDPEVAKKMSELCVEVSNVIFGDISVKELYEGKFSLDNFEIVPVAMATSDYVGEVIRGFVIHSGPQDWNFLRNIQNARIILLQESLEPNTQIQTFRSNEEKRNFDERKEVGEKVDIILQLKVKVILCSQGIDSRTFSKLKSKGILVLSNIGEDILYKSASAIGSKIISSLKEIEKLQANKVEEFIGEISSVEVRNFQRTRITVFSGVKDQRLVSLIVSSASAPMIHSACRGVICGMAAIKNAYEDLFALPGAGASEIAMGDHVREKSLLLEDKRRSVWKSFAKSLEYVPGILASNLQYMNRFQSVITALRKRIREGKSVMGVNLNDLSPIDPLQMGILDGYRAKVQALACALETVSVILRVDRILQAVELKRSNNDEKVQRVLQNK